MAEYPSLRCKCRRQMIAICRPWHVNASLRLPANFSHISSPVSLLARQNTVKVCSSQFSHLPLLARKLQKHFVSVGLLETSAFWIFWAKTFFSKTIFYLLWKKPNSHAFLIERTLQILLMCGGYASNTPKALLCSSMVASMNTATRFSSFEMGFQYKHLLREFLYFWPGV